MALRLKQQKYSSRSGVVGFAQVCVDTGVYHLDYLLDYSIPKELSDDIVIGSRVQIPFNGKPREGIVHSLSQIATATGRIQPITKLLSAGAITTTDIMELVTQSAQRWACHPWDIWRSALPSRVASVEKLVKEGSDTTTTTPTQQRPSRRYLFLPPHRPWAQVLAEEARHAQRTGSVLVILPDEKDVSVLIEELEGAINLSSHQQRSDRYANYLSALRGEKVIAVGNRSAIFTPFADLVTIIIHRELSENYYEERQPQWNVRDIALMRSDSTSTNLLFTGYGPSIEMARLIDIGYVAFVSGKQRLNVACYPPEKGELLPGKVISDIRSSLRNGSIMLLVPRKGYASGVTCSHCRNVAHHSCGGVITQDSLSGPYLCTLCGASIPALQCHWCSRKSFYITGRGVARISEEIGKAFPNVPIFESTAEHMISEVPQTPSIIITTAGAQPRDLVGYSGVYILDAQRFLAGIDPRSLERAEESFYYSFSLGRKDGRFGITAPQSHPVIAGLARWNPKVAMVRQLAERKSASLPPYFRSVIISTKEIPVLIEGFKKAISDGRVPASTQIQRREKGIWMYVPFEDSSALIDFLHELQRRRSVSKKKLLSIRIDPYENM